MTRDEALGYVLELACLTEDRSPEEQRALLDIALHCDAEFGVLSILNRKPQRPRFTRMAIHTYNPDEGRRVRLTKAQRERLANLEAAWKMCPRCYLPVGAHYADDKCPFLANDIKRLEEAVQR